MKRKDLVDKIMDVAISYHFGIGHHMVPDDFIKWNKAILLKLNNVSLAKEAREHGVELNGKKITADDILY